LEDQLQFDNSRESFAIDRAHRLGRRNKTFSRRPIIVAFRDYIDTERILSRAYMLRPTRFAIDRDYPIEINKARSLLWNRYKELKRAGKKVSIQYPAKLVLEGKVIENALPDWYEILKGNRIEPVVSATVNAANSRAMQAKAQTTEHTNKTNDTSYKGANTYSKRYNTGVQNRVQNMWSEVVSQNSQSCDKVYRHGSESSDMTVDENDEDDADAEFYSQYVSRMGDVETNRNTSLLQGRMGPCEEPQPTLLSMTDFPPLNNSPDTTKPAPIMNQNSNIDKQYSTQLCINKQTLENDSSKTASRSNAVTNQQKVQGLSQDRVAVASPDGAAQDGRSDRGSQGFDQVERQDSDRVSLRTDRGATHEHLDRGGQGPDKGQEIVHELNTASRSDRVTQSEMHDRNERNERKHDAPGGSGSTSDAQTYQRGAREKDRAPHVQSDHGRHDRGGHAGRGRQHPK
ncbi:MAG: hypothetical protein N0E48_25555, partial [Candidatus Thiodiazotropha endolucinida]|nr:hypothetical protein [Candidatus Thiodiazotropha taylori]MCW4346692.1 hypothetical protein [Candidatus Thiodiazotropha endolucinida]